jgi:transposase
MAPLRGWGPRGRRLEARVPHGHWKTLTFIAALRSDRVDAPWVIDGPINGELFTLYVEKVLVPTLAKGDVVILDNLGSHKGKAARRAIRAPAPISSSCRPTAPTSTRSNRASQSSRRICAKPRNAPSQLSMVGSAAPSNASSQPNSKTTSENPDMLRPDRILL